MKNLMLGLVTFLLACFLTFLLFIAMNQNALVKVHEFICSKPDVKNVAVNKVESIFLSHNTIDAAIQPSGLNNPRNGKNATPVAQNTTQVSNNDETANKHLPPFTSALGSAQSLVNHTNQTHNRYNDYAIDKSYKGKYYYVFTFENAKKQGTYYRVTVDAQNNAHIYDASFKPVKTKEQNITVSKQEMGVIAQKYAQDQLSPQAILSNANCAAQGMNYTFVNPSNHKRLKAHVTNSGSVVNLPLIK